MKAKTLSLMTLSILALVLVVGLTSAAVDFSPVAFTQSVEQGDSITLSFTATEDGYGNLTGITFNTPVVFTSGSNTFNSVNSVSGAITSLAQNEVSGTMSLIINVPIFLPS